MAAQPAIAAAPAALPRIRLLGVLAVIAALFILGLVVTVLLALATRQTTNFGSWLAPLLAASSYMPWALGLGMLPALVYAARNRVRLARRLIGLMAMQFALACGIGILPLWLVFQATRQNFDETFAAVASIRNSVLLQSRRQLETVGAQIGQGLWPQVEAGAGGIGLTLDGLRAQHQLNQLAIIDDTGRVLEISPATGSLEEFSALVVQRIHRGGGDFWVRERNRQQLTEVLVLPRGAPEAGSGRQPLLALWMEKRLPLALSDDLREIEQSLTSYQSSESVRAGIQQGLQLVVFNAAALLLFVAVNLAVYFGTQLGARLSHMSDTMQQLASYDSTHGQVEVAGDDEITTVSRSFNALIAKQRALRGDLQTIQDMMDSGLIVLAADNRVLSFNRAATKLLQVGAAPAEPLPNEKLAEFAERQPHLAEFAARVGQLGDRESGGEVSVGGRRLLARSAELPGRATQRVVVFTDISEPMAVQKLDAQQEAFQETLHGINNPLQVALLKAEVLHANLDSRLDAESIGRLRQNVSQILHQLERIRDQAQWWDKKGKLADHNIAAYDANAEVRACVENTECGSTEIELILAPELPPVLAEENMLHDALENLFSNSQQQFAITGQPERHIRISTLQDQNKVALVFEDDAGGLPAAQLPRIFERNVSFKDNGQGIGLARARESLAKVGATIKASQGTLRGRAGLRLTLTFQAAAGK